MAAEPQRDLGGSRALITGSTSGIGLGIARVLASRGADIVLNGFGDADEIEAMVREIGDAHGVKVRHDGTDLSKADDIRTMIETAEHEGGIDILVNNAGIQHVDPIEDFPPERWDAVIALNLSAAWHTIHHVLPGMRRRGRGRIINIASAHGLVASPGKSAYVAAKHGLVGLTKVVGLETAGTPITCNAICPGWVLTPLVQKQIDAQAEELGISIEASNARLLGDKQPSGEFVTPEQIGEMCAFLCTSAAAQICGAALSVDGGWTAQ